MKTWLSVPIALVLGVSAQTVEVLAKHPELAKAMQDAAATH